MKWWENKDKHCLRFQRKASLKWYCLQKWVAWALTWWFALLLHYLSKILYECFSVGMKFESFFFYIRFFKYLKSKHKTSWFISHSLDLNLKAVAVISQYKGTFLKSTFKWKSVTSHGEKIIMQISISSIILFVYGRFPC